MSECSGTCEYVLDPEKPETWGGEEGDFCHIGRECLDEDGLWHCPHDTEGTSSLCIFHRPTEEKDDSNVIDSFLQVCQELKSPSGKESRTEFFGAKLKNFHINGENIENKNSPIFLNHCQFWGDTDFSGATFTGSIYLRGSQFCEDVDFSGMRLKEGSSFIGSTFEGEAKFDEAIFQEADFARRFSSQVRFANRASFFGTVFEGRCDFSGAVFESDTGFVGSVFRDMTRFREAEFIKDVDFTEATFDSDSISFSGAQFGGRTQFDGVDLTNADLSDITLDSGGQFRKTNFTDADLTDAVLSGSNLERSIFSRADLFGTQLDGCAFYGGVFGDSQINEETEFGSRCVYDTEYNSEPAADFDGDRTNRLTKAAGQYRIIEQLARTNSFPEMVSHNFVNRQDIYREKYWEERRWGRWLRASTSRMTLLYGESPWRLLGTGLASILIFTFLYPLGGWIQPEGEDPITYSAIAEDPLLLGDSLYYSTLTFTTLGMGDYQPVGLGQYLTTANTALGAILIALLVFVFGRRASR